MTAKQEAATRILATYYLVAGGSVATVVACLLVVPNKKRSGLSLLLPMVGLTIGMISFIIGGLLGGLLTTYLLIDNCGAGGGCGQKPEWANESAAFLATGLPLIAMVVLGAAFLVWKTRRR